MEPEPRPVTRDDLHATYVERSARELQRMVQENEDILTTLRNTAGTTPVSSAAASLGIMTQAYEDAAQAEPFLPFPDSVLPALLALRKTHQVVAESQSFLASQGPASLERARKQLAMEKAHLGDQKTLQAALEARVAALRSGLETRSEMMPAERRQEKLDALRTKKRDYDKDTFALLKALKGFIQDQLGPMLAAEELGGPVVGGMVDVQADDLEAGFSSQGKLKKSNEKAKGRTSTNKNHDERQRRIDEIWTRRGEGETNNEDDNDNDGEENHDADSGDGNEHQSVKAAAASAEMQELTEQLLNALAESGGDSSSAYVTIPRESAAARFLIRSKVAQFHPRDATRLRLIDFGRELDD